MDKTKEIMYHVKSHYSKTDTRQKIWLAVHTSFKIVTPVANWHTGSAAYGCICATMFSLSTGFLFLILIEHICFHYVFIIPLYEGNIGYLRYSACNCFSLIICFRVGSAEIMRAVRSLPAVLFLVIFCNVVSGFYVPGVAPRDYSRSENVDIKVQLFSRHLSGRNIKQNWNF